MDRIPVIIPAAGRGNRMHNSRPKQFLDLGGRPVIAHTLGVFEKAEKAGEIILVCAPGEEDWYKNQLIPELGLTKKMTVVTGGAERQDSVACGLRQLAEGTEYVMIHDGARPLVPVDLVDRLAAEIKNHPAIIPAVPVKDTVKMADRAGFVTATLERDKLWSVQTPQIFRTVLLKEAFKQAAALGLSGTDDASLVERIGVRVKVVMGSYDNLKITTPEDMVMAEAILRRREIP